MESMTYLYLCTKATNRRFPENGFEDGPCCRGCDHIVTHAFDLHLWSRKTGKVAFHFQTMPPHGVLLRNEVSGLIFWTRRPQSNLVTVLTVVGDREKTG